MTESPELRPELGPMNFDMQCTVEGRPARLTMNRTTVFLLVADNQAVPCPFLDVASDGSGRTRELRLGTTTARVVFDANHSAERFDRVLGVRQHTERTGGAFSPVARALTSSAARPVVKTGLTARENYTQYADLAMMTSAVLIVVGTIGVGVGVIAGIIVLFSNFLAGLITLFAAIAGGATPLCLGFLTRAVILRHRLHDAT